MKSRIVCEDVLHRHHTGVYHGSGVLIGFYVEHYLYLHGLSRWNRGKRVFCFVVSIFADIASGVVGTLECIGLH